MATVSKKLKKLKNVTPTPSNKARVYNTKGPLGQYIAHTLSAQRKAKEINHNKSGPGEKWVEESLSGGYNENKVDGSVRVKRQTRTNNPKGPRFDGAGDALQVGIDKGAARFKGIAESKKKLTPEKSDSAKKMDTKRTHKNKNVKDLP
jgi:hypothetical protein